MPYLSIKEIDKIARQIENKEIVETKEILLLQNKNRNSVAHWLAYHSDTTKWSTNDKDILKLQDKDEWSVAHQLAKAHPTWKTDDIEILSLYTPDWEETVEDTLVEEGKR